MVWRIRIETHNTTAFVHHRTCVWYCIVHFEFIRPPIGKSRGTCSMPGNFISNLVTFKDMLQAGHTNTKRFHCTQEYENFILPVRMTMNQSFSMNNLKDGFHFKVLQVWLCLFGKDVFSFFVSESCVEAIFKKCFYSHS